MSNSRPNTEGLRRATDARSQAAFADVRRALREMVRAGERITMQGVASRSGRSARYIRTHPVLGPEVRKHRKATSNAPLQAAPEPNDPTLAALRHHMQVVQRQHEQEVTDLRQQLGEAQEQIERLTAMLVERPSSPPLPTWSTPSSS